MERAFTLTNLNFVIAFIAKQLTQNRDREGT
jgi:hypothetical protein